MSNKKILLIVNPCSGKTKIKTKLLDVVEIFSNAGYSVTVYPTKCRSDATETVKNIKKNEFDTIVVCGGDGTLNEVITGIMQSGLDIPLGYIPAGTLNEWSTGLNISKDIVKAAKDILNGNLAELDIGKFSDKYFSYTASFGAFTEASYSAPQDVKNVLGQAAYFFEGVKSLANIKPVHLKLICDGKETEGDFLFGAISNSMSVGGIVKYKDNLVKLNDGLFEVFLVRKPSNVLDLQPILDGLLKQDLTRDGLEFFHAKEIEITGSKDISWTLDGEFCEGKETLTVTNMQKAIKFIVPNTLNVFEEN